MLTRLPGSHHHITGVASLRGESVPVIDLRSAIISPSRDETQENNLIITEYNRTAKASVDKCVISWIRRKSNSAAKDDGSQTTWRPSRTFKKKSNIRSLRSLMLKGTRWNHRFTRFDFGRCFVMSNLPMKWLGVVCLSLLMTSSTARNQIKGTFIATGFEHYWMLRWPTSA